MIKRASAATLKVLDTGSFHQHLEYQPSILWNYNCALHNLYSLPTFKDKTGKIYPRYNQAESNSVKVTVVDGCVVRQISRKGPDLAFHQRFAINVCIFTIHILYFIFHNHKLFPNFNVASICRCCKARILKTLALNIIQGFAESSHFGVLVWWLGWHHSILHMTDIWQPTNHKSQILKALPNSYISSSQPRATVCVDLTVRKCLLFCF